MDPRHVLSAFLTLSMFVMLANMIKKEHFDSAQVDLQTTRTIRIIEENRITVQEPRKGPSIEENLELKPCWTKPTPKMEQSKGFITFSLTDGPEYHVSQIADAVVVARYLGATLVLPDIRGSSPGEMRSFHEIYDVETFIKSLDGVVKVVKEQPPELSMRKLAFMRVPNRVTEEHIAEHIEPIFQKKGYLRLATFFPSIDMKKAKEKKELDSIACLAIHSTLKLQPKIHEVINSMVERLRTLSRKSNRRFIAVDLRVDVLETKRCQGRSDNRTKSCYSAPKIGEFLKNIGFDRDTPIYLTHSRWHSSLDALKKIFPNTYTKEGIMPADKNEFLNSGTSDFEKNMDFYICSHSDVFVPTIPGLFYAIVAGKRIASGRTQILVPSEVPTSASPSDFISPYVSQKDHMAYSCFC